MTITTHPIILFDGVCNVCNGLVQFIIGYDHHDVFRFAPLQSEKANELLRPFGPAGTHLTTIVLLEGGTIVTESEAVLKIAGRLGGGWSFFSRFIIVPRFIRDGIYRFISRYRYAIFGQRDSCMIPTPELKNKFVDGG